MNGSNRRRHWILAPPPRTSLAATPPGRGKGVESARQLPWRKAWNAAGIDCEPSHRTGAPKRRRTRASLKHDERAKLEAIMTDDYFGPLFPHLFHHHNTN